MTSLSTRFFGHPRLMNPAFGMKGGPATAEREDYSSMACSLPPSVRSVPAEQRLNARLNLGE
jgi:hypothetical protein